MKRRRFTIRAHPAGLALLLLALFFCESGAALAAALALVTHEAAHMLAMLMCGVKSCEVELTPFGGVADVAGYEALSPLRQLAVALSGVTASLISGLLCLRLAPVTPFWGMLWRFNLSLALVNCLPVWPLDGARAVMAAASRLGLAPLALRVMRALAYALSLALVALGVWGASVGQLNLSLILAGPYLCYAAGESALSGGMRLTRRMEAAGESLKRGAVLPARVLICGSRPDALGITRIIGRAPSQSYCLLCVASPDGDITETLTEKRMSDMILGGVVESEQSGRNDLDAQEL